ncbi:MAG: hypothetical protein GW778_08520 [Alphaproteobacteria bacterium]|nr:hypothetical protein [Alphaproteobacteria bacterium]
MKKWLGRLAKLSFFLIAFLGVVITVLFNMGGDSDTLKGAIEDYITASSGYATKIKTFNNMTFFPNISVDAEGIILKKPDIKAMQAWADEEAQKPEEERGTTPPPIDFFNPDATIEKAIIAIGFWDVTLAHNKNIKNIQIRNAEFKAGTVHEKPLHIETLGIDETPEGKPFIALSGALGSDKFSGGLDIESIGTRSNPKYKLGEEGAFDFKVGNITMTGILRPRTMGGLHIRDLKIINNEQEIIDATFTFIRGAEGNIAINGNFTAPEFGSNGTFDWNIIAAKNMQITGNIAADTLYQDDFSANSRISKTWKEWASIFMTSDAPANESHAIAVTADTFTAKSKTVQDFTGGASIKDNQMIFTPSEPKPE